RRHSKRQIAARRRAGPLRRVVEIGLELETDRKGCVPAPKKVEAKPQTRVREVVVAISRDLPRFVGRTLTHAESDLSVQIDLVKRRIGPSQKREGSAELEIGAANRAEIDPGAHAGR